MSGVCEKELLEALLTKNEVNYLNDIHFDNVNISSLCGDRFDVRDYQDKESYVKNFLDTAFMKNLPNI